RPPARLGAGRRGPVSGWLGGRRQSFGGRQVEREAKDHSPLTGNDLRNILERKNQEPPALLAGADDEVAGAIPAPAQLLDHAEQPLRRFDTETHALREAAIKPPSLG